MKGELLEGGLRIPAIVRWPGRVATESVSEQVMISMDWMPTLLAAAGVQPDPAYPPDGDNLLPTLTGRGRRIRANCSGAITVEGSARSAIATGNISKLRQRVPLRYRSGSARAANLKDRRSIFDRLKSDWEAWNSTMLPERTRPATYGNRATLWPIITASRTQNRTIKAGSNRQPTAPRQRPQGRRLF